MRHGFTRRLAIALLGGGSSCEAPEPDDAFEDLPIRYVTEELELATGFAEPLCEGDFQWLDNHTRQVEDALGIDTERLWELHIYDEHPVPGCPEDRTGCFRRDEDVALGMPGSLPHEIVHLVSVDLGPPPSRFWNEGLAEALAAHPLGYVPSDLVAETTSNEKYIDYAIPGHFVRWLIEWRGSDAVKRVFQGEEFAGVYGMELEEVEQLYDAEAPEVLPPLHPCEDEPLLAAEDGTFELETEFDCGDPTTTRIRHGYKATIVGSVHVIEVTEPTTYAVNIQGGKAALIGGCQAVSGDRFDQIGDVQNDTARVPDRMTTYLRAGDQHDISLEPWTYRVYLIAEDTGDPGDVALRMIPQ